MGKKLIIGLLLIALVGYAVINTPLSSYVKSHVEFNVSFGSPKNIWVNSNFTEATGNLGEHSGDRVEIDGLLFNAMSYNNSEGRVGLEVYLGNKQQLVKAPLDTTRRILVGYNSTLAGTLSYGDCIHVSGHIAGEATVTTLDGHVIKPPYIKASNVTIIPCSTLG